MTQSTEVSIPECFSYFQAADSSVGRSAKWRLERFAKSHLDISDDLAIVIDADAADPGDRAAKNASHRLAGTVRSALATLAGEPVVVALGVPNSITDARLIAQGTWVRAIIAIGPRHLARAVERANALLATPGAPS